MYKSPGSTNIAVWPGVSVGVELRLIWGDFAVAPSHTTGRALLHPAVRQRIDRIAASRLPASDISSPSAGEGSALWPDPGSFTAFAQPVVAPFGAFCLHRLSHEPLKFLPSSTFGPSRHLRVGTMASADSCRLYPTSQPGLPSEDGLAAGLPR